MDFPGGTSGKNLACQCRKHRDVGLIPGSGIFPGGQHVNPSPVFLPGESHGQRRLVGYSPWGGRESDMTEGLSTHTHIHQTKI